MYRSRIPAIAAGLPVAMEAVIKETAEAIANTAKERVPVASGALRESIEAKEGEFTFGARSRFAEHASGFGVRAPSSRGVVAVEAYGVWMAWYGIYAEYGTSHSPARPFMTPAAEEHRATLVALGAASLRRL